MNGETGVRQRVWDAATAAGVPLVLVRSRGWSGLCSRQRENGRKGIVCYQRVSAISLARTTTVLDIGVLYHKVCLDGQVFVKVPEIVQN